MAHKGIFIALGSNIGNTETNIDNACKLLLNAGINIVNESSLYLTEPWGKRDQARFLNCIIEVSTTMKPDELLACTQNIERYMKRRKNELWGPRIIDIDIIIYNDIILTRKDLIIPHKYLNERYFWLYMLNEMYENLEIPPDNRIPAVIMDSGIEKQKMEFIEKRKYSQWRRSDFTV